MSVQMPSADAERGGRVQMLGKSGFQKRVTAISDEVFLCAALFAQYGRRRGRIC